MPNPLISWFNRAERNFRHSFGKDISTPRERRRSMRHYNWLDHAILRVWWRNFHEVAPGVYRSNHPTHKRFVEYADMGITHILNLRGEDKYAHYLFEVESCDMLGLTLVDHKLYATKAPDAQKVLELIDLLRDTPRPYLIHCKSGADRTGLAAVLVLYLLEGEPLDTALKQLDGKFMHARKSKAGVLDYFFEVYRARTERDPIAFTDWLKTEYDQAQLQKDFDQLRANKEWR